MTKSSVLRRERKAGGELPPMLLGAAKAEAIAQNIIERFAQAEKRLRTIKTECRPTITPQQRIDLGQPSRGAVIMMGRAARSKLFGSEEGQHIVHRGYTDSGLLPEGGAHVIGAKYLMYSERLRRRSVQCKKGKRRR